MNEHVEHDWSEIEIVRLSFRNVILTGFGEAVSGPPLYKVDTTGTRRNDGRSINLNLCVHQLGVVAFVNVVPRSAFCEGVQIVELAVPRVADSRGTAVRRTLP